MERTPKILLVCAATATGALGMALGFSLPMPANAGEQDAMVGQTFVVTEDKWSCSTYEEHNKLSHAVEYGTLFDVSRAASEAKECMVLHKGDQVRVVSTEPIVYFKSGKRTWSAEVQFASYPYHVKIDIEFLEKPGTRATSGTTEVAKGCHTLDGASC